MRLRSKECYSRIVIGMENLRASAADETITNSCLITVCSDHGMIWSFYLRVYANLPPKDNGSALFAVVVVHFISIVPIAGHLNDRIFHLPERGGRGRMMMMSCPLFTPTKTDATKHVYSLLPEQLEPARCFAHLLT